jgi:CheY-like chemotaxis protein
VNGQPVHPQPTVLLVDDEAVVLAVLSRILERSGYVTVRAGSAEDALRYLSAAAPHSIQAVLSDIRMPQMSGLDLALELRRRWPDLPIALMTAYEAAELHPGHPGLGAVPVLRKPFASKAVLDLIRDLTRPPTRRAG